MNPRAGRSDLLIALGLAGALCLLAAIALAFLSRPSHYADRMSAVQAKVEQTETVHRALQASSGLDATVLCTGAASDQAQRVHAAVTAYAAQAGATLSGLSASPDELGSQGAGLTPVLLQFRASGSYPSAITILQRLAEARPRIFADSLDLESDGPTVTLNFSGRFYCAA